MVFLRELTKTDIPLVNLWRQSKKLQDYFGSPFRYINIETDEDWFEQYMNNRSKQVRLSICLKDTNEMIGMASIVNIDMLSRKAEYGGIMIGNKTDRGKGIGQKATMLLLSHAFMNLNMNRIQGLWLVSNNASIIMGKKCGFREEGILRSSLFKNGQYVDLLVMSILRTEFDEISATYNWDEA